MERIAYFLGAGFSAPLGLPVMSNFLEKSRDQFYSHPEKYSNFEAIHRRVNEMSSAKNYFSADLHNIEEILSIMELQDKVGGSGYSKDFIRYIEDVIKFHTPKFKSFSPNSPKNEWANFLVSEDNPLLNRYADFVMSLFRMNLSVVGDSEYIQIGRKEISEESPSWPYYSVVSMNYDMVLESIASASYPNFNLEFKTNPTETDLDWSDGPYLAKLHGSVDGKSIIPPTWNKSLKPEIVDAWKLGHQILSSATQIRIVGYSMPEADSYVRYLLKSVAIKNPNLKRIDVLCMDPSGQVRATYDDFITYPKYNFLNLNFEDYVGSLGFKMSKGLWKRTNDVSYDQLENVHQDYLIELNNYVKL